MWVLSPVSCKWILKSRVSPCIINRNVKTNGFISFPGFGSLLLPSSVDWIWSIVYSPVCCLHWGIGFCYGRCRKIINMMHPWFAIDLDSVTGSFSSGLLIISTQCDSVNFARHFEHLWINRESMSLRFNPLNVAQALCSAHHPTMKAPHYP